MGYIVDYEVCALLFLIVVTIRFFSMRKFHIRSNRIFGLTLFCAIANLALDIYGAYLIDNASSVPLWLNYTVNTGYYMLQVTMPAVLLMYVISLSCVKTKSTTYLVLLPVIVELLLLLINPFTGWVFTFDRIGQSVVLTRNMLFNVMYVNCAFYLIIMVVTVLRLRRQYRKIEARTILSFVALTVAAVFIQYMIPQILLTGVVVAVSLFMMFLTMQNPETMLDSITGTFNYSALTEYLRRKIAENKALFITAVDVGGIRRVNSAMGIRTGNELLEQVGEYINAICGNRATTFRMIGTRFIIISENLAIHNEIVEKITRRFKTPWQFENTGIILIATIRYCEQNNIFTTPEDVENLIDLAYSKTAAEGFGTTLPIDTEQLELFRRKGLIRDAISHALATGDGFYLNFQPLYSVEEKRFCGAEALLRFNDRELGVISPAEFIPIAESTGQIYLIDRMVVGMACNFLKSHPELIQSGMRQLEINLSASEFNGDTTQLYNTIISNIESIENRICFEVTETAVTSRREILSDFMQRLIDRGVRFAIDDFGSGYANITQLAMLPFSVVKLDRLFTSHYRGKEAMVLSDLVNMFDHIGLSTVFEGIETAEQAEYASQLGVEQIQGFFYSRPLSGDEFVRLMKAQSSAQRSEGA